MFTPRMRRKARLTRQPSLKIRAYEKRGFRHDGVLRDEAIVGGKYVDHLVMSILEDEYSQQATI